MCTVVNKYKEQYDVYIGRGSVWGNDYSHLPEKKASHKVDTREEAVSAYRKQIWDSIRSGKITVEMLKSLNGKKIGCFCKPKSCHGDIIVLAVGWSMNQ